MTREEFIEKLKKINGVEVMVNILNSEIRIALNQVELYYDFDEHWLDILQDFNSINLCNRSPKEVLAIVKALVE